MTKALLITYDSEISEVEYGGLNDLQSFVGGLIEPILLELDGVEFEGYINEEGKLENLPFNSIGSELLHRNYGGDYVSGNLLVIGPIDDEGESTDIEPHVIDALRDDYWDYWL